MKFKIVVWIVAFAIFLNMVFAHDLFGKNIIYDNTFEKLFIYDQFESKNQSIKSNDKIMDFIIYWSSKQFKENIFNKPNYKAQDYLIYLDEELNKLKVDFEDRKFRITTLRLRDYYSRIKFISNQAKNQDFLKNKASINKKIGNDLIFFDGIFNSLGTDGRLLVYQIFENDVSLLIQNHNGTKLVEDLDICGNTKSILKYVCYKTVIKEIVKGNKEEIRFAINSIKKRMEKSVIDAEECHFLSHEVGFFIGNQYGLSGASKCLDTYDECTFGCYHGIAEYLFFSNNASSKNRNSLNLQSLNDSFEILTLYHAFGHPIYRFTNDIKEAKLMCDDLAKQNKKRALMCYSGIGHEFSLENFFTNLSFEDASEKCSQYNDSKGECYYHLAATYSHGNLNKTLQGCYSSGSYDCFVGMGLFIDGVYSGGNLSKSINACSSLVEDKRLVNFCYKGILASSVYFYNNLTRAVAVCTNIDNTLQCYNNLKSIYKDWWFNASLNLCNFVENDVKEICYRENLDIVDGNSSVNHS